MPLYEYRCQACGQSAEFLQKISEPLRVECPHCHELKLVKQLTAAGFQLKGQGWYATDFKGKAPATSSQETPKVEPTKTETPPAPTPSTTP
jgi:putative FmdB family regulatory protein